MSDVNTFIDTIGRDVNATVTPRIKALAESFSARAQSDYVPRVSEFANQLVKDIINEQSATFCDFVNSLIQELCQRYHPELSGELHANIKNGGVELTGHGTRLDLKRRDTGAAVASLDLPVSLQIKVEDVGVKLQNTTIRLNVTK